MDCMLHMRFFYKVVIECRIFFACRGAFTALFCETSSASMVYTLSSFREKSSVNSLPTAAKHLGQRKHYVGV